MTKPVSKSAKHEEMSRRRTWAHDKLRALKSKVYDALLEVERAAFADGELPKKMKELIAAGISVAGDCGLCMQWHIEQAARPGAAQPVCLSSNLHVWPEDGKTLLR